MRILRVVTAGCNRPHRVIPDDGTIEDDLTADISPACAALSIEAGNTSLNVIYVIPYQMKGAAWPPRGVGVVKL